jgi:molecular chaperone GrpE
VTATQENFKESMNDPRKDTMGDSMADTGADQAATAEDAGSLPYEELQSALQAAHTQVEEQRNQLLRTRAEMENLRRRAERDLENAHKYSLERFINEILPIKDSLEMGLQVVSEDATETVDMDKVREGMDLTLKMMQALLQKMAVREINPLGEKFNPDMHQAMMAQEATDAEPNTVLAVYQKGYSLNDRVVRPAMVVVSKAPLS